MTAQTIEQLIFRKSAYIIVAIENNNQSIADIQKKIKIERAWIVKIIKMLEAEKLIVKEKEGRNLKINLTTKGEILSVKIQDIIELLKENVLPFLI